MCRKTRRATYRQTAIDARHATARADASGAVITAETDRIRDTLLANWDSERLAVREAAHVVLDGPGRPRLRWAAVNRAGEQLVDWADAWRPYLPAMPTGPQEIARLADRSDDRPRLWTAFDSYARHHAEQAHPEHSQLREAADAARNAHEQARRALAEAIRRRDERLDPFGSVAWSPDQTGGLADLDLNIAATRQELTDTEGRIAALTAEPALRAQPPDRLTRRARRLAHTAHGGPRPARAGEPAANRPGLGRPTPRDGTPRAFPRPAWHRPGYRPMSRRPPPAPAGSDRTPGRTTEDLGKRLAVGYQHEPPIGAFSGDGAPPSTTPERAMADHPADREPELLTIIEAAEFLRAPVATLRYWRHLGTGPRSFRLGRRVIYWYNDLQAEWRRSWAEAQLCPDPAEGQQSRTLPSWPRQISWACSVPNRSVSAVKPPIASRPRRRRAGGNHGQCREAGP